MKTIARYATPVLLLIWIATTQAYGHPNTVIDLPDSVILSGGDSGFINSGFENGLAGWTVFGVVSLDSSQPYVGLNSVSVGSSSSPSRVLQSAFLPGGPSYVEIFAKGYAQTDGASHSAKSAIKLVDDAGNQLAELVTFSSQNVYQRYLFDISCFAGRTVSVALEVVPDGSYQGAILADNIRLVHNPVVFASSQSRYHFRSFLAGQSMTGGSSQARWDINPVFNYASFLTPPLDEGPHTLEYWSTPPTGSSEPTNSHYVTVDATPPITMIVSQSPTENSGGIEMISNGGFEIPLSSYGALDWSMGGSAYRSVDASLSGSAALCLGRNGQTGEASQQWALDATQQQIFSFYFQISAPGSGTGLALSFRDNQSQTIVTLPAFTDAPQWRKVTVGLGALRGRSVRAQFKVVGSSGSGGAPLVYVDNVSFTKGGTIKCGAQPWSLLGYDSSAGVGRTEYTIPGGWSLDGSLVPLGFLQSVDYRSLDLTGNLEAKTTLGYWADINPPGGFIQINNGSTTTASRSISLQLNASDAASSVAHMRIRSDTDVWGPWIGYTNTMAYTLLGTTPGSKTICAQYRDPYGNESPIVCDTINYNSQAVLLGSAKKAAVGTAVRLEGCLVTAVFASPPGGIFVVQQGKACGILVETTEALPGVGDLVSIDGQTLLAGPELWIAASGVQIAGSAAVRPIVILSNWVGGAVFGSQPASDGGKGLNTVGQFVELAGRVTARTTGLFWLDDGTGVSFGTEPAGIGIIVDSAITLPAVGSIVRVVGISRLVTSAVGNIPRVQTRNGADIVLERLP